MSTEAIHRFWLQLQSVTRFAYESRCGPGSKTGWAGTAKGHVDREIAPSEDWIHFHELCRFVLNQSGETFELKNQYRWHFLREEEKIRLEHWRRGSPVHLVDLTPAGDNRLQETSSHLCGADQYQLEIVLGKAQFEANWRIKGPKKDESIFYVYS